MLHLPMANTTPRFKLHILFGALIYALYLFNPVPPGLVFFGLSGLLWVIIFGLDVQGISPWLACLRLMIYSVPVSFISLIGVPYGELSLSWFNLFTLLTIIIGLWEVGHRERLRIGWFSLGAIALSILTLPSLLISLDLASGVKQYIHIVSFSIILITMENLYHKFNEHHIAVLMTDYLLTACLTGVGVVVQVVLVKSFNQIYGDYRPYGGGRETANFIFSDTSFLALYLASGAGIACALLLEEKRRKWIHLLVFVFLLGVSVLTTARTGFVAFVLAMALVLLPQFMQRLSWRKLFIISLLLIFAAIGGYVMLLLRPQGFLAGSGRLENSQVALENIASSPLYGVGLGVSSYPQFFHTEIPHNLLLQFLDQTGGIGFTGLLILMALLAIAAWRTKQLTLRVCYFIIFVGSMFIPDLLNSRFFLVCSMLVVLSAAIRRHSRTIPEGLYLRLVGHSSESSG